MRIPPRALARLTAVVAASALLSGPLASSTASAAAEPFPGKDRPTITTIAPGATSVAQLAVNNTSGRAQTLPGEGAVMEFTAPEGATFADQIMVDTRTETYDHEEIATRETRQLFLNPCERSEGNKKLTCEINGEGSDFPWAAGDSHAFFPLLAVDGSTPLGKQLAPGKGVLTFTAQSEPDKGRNFSFTMSMQVRTPTKIPLCLGAGSNPTFGTQPRLNVCQDIGSQQFTRYGSLLENAVSRLCLNVGDRRDNGAPVVLRACQDATPNQDLIPVGDKIKVEDTIGKAKEMCLGVGAPLRKGNGLQIWECLDVPGQYLVHLATGQIAVRSTLENS
ncbi:hypothetical protein ACFV6F_30670 [Kitasatospora phosalacinea]|uniref:hypothetical protein n=1 Tax=Kitasatospora phosalacinea TaxID=2065 RepID=UPI003663125D